MSIKCSECNCFCPKHLLHGQWRAATSGSRGNSRKLPDLMPPTPHRPTHSCLSVHIFRFEAYSLIKIHWMLGTTASQYPSPNPLLFSVLLKYHCACFAMPGIFARQMLFSGYNARSSVLTGQKVTRPRSGHTLLGSLQMSKRLSSLFRATLLPRGLFPAAYMWRLFTKTIY